MLWQLEMADCARAAAGYWRSREEAAFQQDVTHRLDMIAEMINSVLASIEALKPFIVNALRAEVIEIYKDEINAARKSLEVVAAGIDGRPTALQIAELTDIAGKLLPGVFKLIGRDKHYQAYPVLNTGVIAYMRFLVVVGANDATARAFAKAVLPYYNAALDAKAEDSWIYALSDANSHLAATTKLWNDHVDRWWQVFSIGNPEYMRVQGTFDASNADNPERANQGTVPAPVVTGFFPFIPQGAMEHELGWQQQWFIAQWGVWRADAKAWEAKIDELKPQVACLDEMRKLLDEMCA